FYDVAGVPTPARDTAANAPVLFAAWQTAAPGAVPVGWDTCGGTGSLVANPPGDVLFYGLPADAGGDGLIEVPGFPGVARVFAPRNAVVVPLSLYPMPDRADAGSDACGVDGPVTLDGSGSYLAGGIMSWEWSWDGGSASGEVVAAELPAGDTVVTLVVGGPGGEARDTVWVSSAGSPTDTGSGTLPEDEKEEPTPGHEEPGTKGGCGCATSEAPPAWLGLLAAAAISRARRRTASRL
ncbi:MAG: hypothetical protein H0V89_08120, partial [Deltaproteobacteria bacterium]|nr:hypothetical protein [Deltaproteobacteria bacterium]